MPNTYTTWKQIFQQTELNKANYEHISHYSCSSVMFFYSLDKLVELLPPFASACIGINGLWLHYHHFEDASQSAEELQSLICCCPLAAAAAFHFRSPEHGCCGSNSSSSMMPSSDILLLLIAAGSALWSRFCPLLCRFQYVKFFKMWNLYARFGVWVMAF